MKTTLKYKFQRQSENHLDWLINFIKSERCFEIEATLINNNSALFLD
ncbi:hypothetical protein QLS71_011250 [Mariniflexile litorale]|uniref:Uncharacterized protein n=1 Tax=Mariniflexile litorale TaxID=3045158 RepID=A0AAU7EC27_9FLAO|nr:hypothetical protein [Mariniflexile sp. KMM 9835]MDQ8212640.1 hypothetical protein [Mariniflexile sp. KMM 9835]